MKTPFFSIITASYNSEKTIEKTILSVLSQTFLDFEYLIIDGGSQDGTLNIIEKYKNQFKRKNITFKYLSKPDEGIYDAWNKGITLSVGNWISFLGSDDTYMKNALEVYYKNILNVSHQINFICSKARQINTKGETIRFFGEPLKKNVFKREMRIAHVGAFHHRTLFEEFGLYNTDFKITGDYEFLLRVLTKLQPAYIKCITVEILGNGISTRLVKSAFKEVKKAKEINHTNINFLINIEYYFSLLKYYITRIKYL